MKRTVAFTSYSLILTIASFADAAILHVDEGAGDPSGDGSADHPFETISACAEAAMPGDTCRIYSGTYRETVVPPRDGTESAPIRFEAVPGECVTILGTEPFDGLFEPFSGDVWAARTEMSFVQLFHEKEMLHEARWPNRETDDLMEMPRGQSGVGTDGAGLTDPEIPEGDWANGMVFILPGKQWQSDTRRIDTYDETEKRITFDREIGVEESLIPRYGNPYYLYNSLLAVDAPTEWFLDLDTDTLYFVPPEGVNPNEMELEVKQRDYAFDVTGRAHIEIAGVRIFGAGIRIENASYCTVDGINARYVSHLRETDAYYTVGNVPLLDGTENTWKNSTIAFSASAGLLVSGNDNLVVNNIVHDVAYMATNHAAIDLSDYTARHERNIIARNTVYRSGRAGIFLYGSRAGRVLYNHVYEWGLMTPDIGGISVWGTDSEGTEIAFNHVHNGQCEWCVGIYMDDSSERFTVHHNYIHDVLWYGLFSKHRNVLFNNTILDVHGSPVTMSLNFQTGAWELDGGFTVNNLDDGILRFKVSLHTTDLDDNGDYEAVVPIDTADEWTHVEVPFASLVQPPWAEHLPIDMEKATYINIVPLTLGTSRFDIDNIQLEGEEPLLLADFETEPVTIAGGGFLWAVGGDGSSAAAEFISTGAHGSEGAVHLESEVVSYGWAQMVIGFGADENTTYDLSPYSGVSFDIKGSAENVIKTPETPPYQENNIACPEVLHPYPTPECAVDKGTPISPFTDGFDGDAPDVGAFESGDDEWNVGAAFEEDWDRCEIPNDVDLELPLWSDFPVDYFVDDDTDPDTGGDDTDDDTSTEPSTDVDGGNDEGGPETPDQNNGTGEAGCGCAVIGGTASNELLPFIVAFLG